MSTIIAGIQRRADSHPLGPIGHVIEHVIGRDRIEAAAEDAWHPNTEIPSEPVAAVIAVDAADDAPDAPQIFLLPRLYRFEQGRWVSEIDSAPLEVANWKRYWWRAEPAMLAELERAVQEGF